MAEMEEKPVEPAVEDGDGTPTASAASSNVVGQLTQGNVNGNATMEQNIGQVLPANSDRNQVLIGQLVQGVTHGTPVYIQQQPQNLPSPNAQEPPAPGTQIQPQGYYLIAREDQVVYPTFNQGINTFNIYNNYFVNERPAENSQHIHTEVLPEEAQRATNPLPAASFEGKNDEPNEKASYSEEGWPVELLRDKHNTLRPVLNGYAFIACGNHYENKPRAYICARHKNKEPHCPAKIRIDFEKKVYLENPNLVQHNCGPPDQARLEAIHNRWEQKLDDKVAEQPKTRLGKRKILEMAEEVPAKIPNSTLHVDTGNKSSRVENPNSLDIRHCILGVEKNTIMFLCNIQEGRQNADIITASASKLVTAANALLVPVVVFEECPERLGKTVRDLDISKALTKEVCEKRWFTLLTPGVLDVLKDNPDRKVVVFFGLEVDLCIEKTALQMLQKGYEVHIVADATSSKTEQERDLALQRLRQFGCIVTTTRRVIFDLLGEREVPEVITLLD